MAAAAVKHTRSIQKAREDNNIMLFLLIAVCTHCRFAVTGLCMNYFGPAAKGRVAALSAVP